MVLGTRNDPYVGFSYLVEIEGMVVGGFSEVTGLKIETEVEDYREGGINEYVHKLPGPSHYPSRLTLKRGLTDADELWGWYMNVVHGKIERKNGSILLKDSAGDEKWRWNFAKAYPVRWTGPDLRAEASAVAVETLELVHHGLSRG